MKETKKIKVEREFYVKCICDICKKVIFTADENSGEINPVLKEYWEIKTSHHDWGRDSVDSIQYRDVCSKSCLASVLLEYIDETVGKDNSKRIEVVHECF